MPEHAEQVAIIGMAALMPGAGSLDSYWRNVVDGVDAISDVPPHRWDPAFFDPGLAGRRADRVYCRRGGFVDELVEFDPLAFGIMPAAMSSIEPDQLIALKVAAEALEDAGGRDRLPSADRIGVILGRGDYLTPGMVRLDQRVRMANQLELILRELVPDLGAARLEQIRHQFAAKAGSDELDVDAAISCSSNLAAARIANRLDLRGPAYTVDAACASSIVAVDRGVGELATGRCDVVLAGGVHHCHDITLWSIFSQLGALSRRGQIRPFDEAADGLVMGEGTGIIVLKRLADAERDNDRVYAVIRGIGISSDGRSASLFNPEPSGQVTAMRMAWSAAGIDPRTRGALGLLEAHGTATNVGDAAEIASVLECFGPGDDAEPAVIGSVKSMIGHAMPAAGIAGLIKAALAVHEGILPPTLHCESPRPELLRTRFVPISSARPWNSAWPRRAAVSAFGFGGINSHVIIEQASEPRSQRGRAFLRRDPPRAVEAREPELIMLTAPDAGALAALLATDDAVIRANGTASASRAASLLMQGGCRIAIFDPTDGRIELARQAVARHAAWRGLQDIWFSPQPLLPEGRIAFVCPGLETPVAPDVGDIAAYLGVPSPGGGPGTLTQQCISLIRLGRLLYDALLRLGVHPDGIAGYSLGEWTAAVCAGTFDKATVDQQLATLKFDMLALPGIVFAVAATSAAYVAPLLDDYPQVFVSHDNAPTQCVICGPAKDVGHIARALREKCITCQVLPIPAGYHTPLLADYVADTRARMDEVEIHPPSLPVWSSAIAAVMPVDAAQIREVLSSQMVAPVQFRATVGAMYHAGFRVFLQLGATQLSSVISASLGGREHLTIPVSVPHRSGIGQLRRVAAALWADGYPVNVAELDAWRPAGRATQAVIRLPSSSSKVKLDLGSPMIRLGASPRSAAANREPAAGQPGPAARMADAGAGVAALTELRSMAGRSPSAAELGALLNETAASAVAILNAAQAAGRPISAPPAAVWRQRLRISLQTMPYLRDHCFVPQQPDWPDHRDRFPVVPGCTLLQHMMAAASEAVPGRIVTSVRDVRFTRWVTAAPEQDFQLTATPTGPDSCDVRFGDAAIAQVDVAAGFPAGRPASWRHEPTTERPAVVEASQFYDDRWVFHGRRFQGIKQLLAAGDFHVRATLTALDTPGGLLDNVLQVLGYWITASHSDRNIIFPVGIRRIRFFGPPPPSGTLLECVVRIQSITLEELVADAQIIDKNMVWAQIEGLTDKRFHNHHLLLPALRHPGRHAISFLQPGNWAAAFELWLDLATRDLTAWHVLGADGYAEYGQQPALSRREWLLRQVAAKDAVRFMLWHDGHGDIFPAEMRVAEYGNGQALVCAARGQRFGDYLVSVASCQETAVAIAEPCQPGTPAGIPGVGIYLAEIAEHQPELTPELSSAESQLLGSADGGERSLWLTRFHAARQAAIRASGGTALSQHRPAVLAATHDAVIVSVNDQSYQVSIAKLSNPDGITTRHYVVAWARPNQKYAHPNSPTEGET